MTYDMKLFALCISVGPLYVDTNVPKMEDVEKQMSSEFNGWVNKGGCWKPTECKARVKVRCELKFVAFCFIMNKVTVKREHDMT